MASTAVIPESELQRMTNVQIAEAVEQNKLDAKLAGQFLLTRATNKLHRQAKKAASA